MDAVIRRAVDRYLDEQAESDQALAATFGLAMEFGVQRRVRAWLELIKG